MYPFWDPIVAPIIRAANAQRLVEIGALRGETTVKMLDDLGPESELHVIDPVPEFDPAEHEQRFPGRYVFHRDLSLNVLDKIGAVDVALVDGDHNWYTVYNELRMLREASRAAGRHLPVLILHDVCWPYGRRDLYYAPEQIPEEFRQPNRQGGIHPDRKKLLPRGGLNAQLHNAIESGGPRNGVMTGLDDFVKEHDTPLRRLLLPIYWGLAIVVEEARLAEAPALAELLDRIESAQGKEELLLLSERIRVDSAVFEQNVWRHKDGLIERGAQRYLDLLAGSLLDDHYLENERRIGYLVDCARNGRQPVEDVLREPARFAQVDWVALRTARETGRNEGSTDPTLAHADMGRERLSHLRSALDGLRERKVAGDLVEIGAGRGGGGIFLRGYLEAWELEGRDVYVGDPFRPGPWGVDLNQVRDAFAAFGLLDDRVHFLLGDPTEIVPAAGLDRIALLRVGGTAVAQVGDVLERTYANVVEGGVVVVDGYDDPAVQAAVDDFRARHGVAAQLERVGWWGASWVRERAAEQAVNGNVTPVAAGRPGRVAHRPPLAPPAPAEPVDLTVVVVFHDMAREAPRTLHSLSRAYQREIDDLTYEVIAVDNGSSPEQRLTAELVASFGPEFRFLDMGPDAPPSPTVALNTAIAQGRGQHFALMIDGAHLLSPGVLRHGMAAMRSYGPAVVSTQQWYVGPGQQPDAVREGYDQSYEDELFATIDWPSDGYRLFEISHFIGDRDWLDGMFESNCVFVPRAVLEQVGGLDDAFDMPGGGYTNLELYERLAASPGVQICTILGEGSFHQVHGGTTTNDADPDARRQKTFAYGENYREVRGRPFRGPTGSIHYVGALQGKGSLRTRSRRFAAPAFAVNRAVGGPDGKPTERSIIPDELRTAFIESFWGSLAWQDASWLGTKVPNAPTDLFVYQELLSTVRPDWVVETGTGSGGRALFLASVCDLLGHGQVLSVDDNQGAKLPEHERLTFRKLPNAVPATFDAVREHVGDGARVLVVLGARSGRDRTIKEFEGLSPLVPVGSYVVVEDTIVNGHPVWPAFGPGPTEALRHILQFHGEFVADPTMERYGLTFNPGGFLKRIS